MIITTGDSIEGRPVTEVYGRVMAYTVRAWHVGRGMLALLFNVTADNNGAPSRLDYTVLVNQVNLESALGELEGVSPGGPDIRRR